MRERISDYQDLPIDRYERFISSPVDISYMVTSLRGLNGRQPRLCYSAFKINSKGGYIYQVGNLYESTRQDEAEKAAKQYNGVLMWIDNGMRYRKQEFRNGHYTGRIVKVTHSCPEYWNG